jgi:hypothetical protein
MATLEDLLIKIGVDTRKVGADSKMVETKFGRALKKVSDGAQTLTKAWAAAGQVAPVAAVGAGAVLSLGAALAGAGVAAGVFGAVVSSSQAEVTEAATKVESLNDKMDLYGKQAEIMKARGEDNTAMLKKQAAASLELQAGLKNLSPAQRDATMGFLQMKEDWGNFVEENQPATFGILTKGYALIGKAVGQLQPFFDMGRDAADRLLGAMQKGVDGGGLKRLAEMAGPALDSLTGIIINTGGAIAGMFGKVGAKQGNGFLAWLEEVTAKWKAWATATEDNEGINKFINYISTNGPVVGQTLKDIAAAATNIATALSPLAPLSMAIASSLAAIVAAVPPDVLTAIVAAFIAYSTALKLYAIYQAIATAAQWAYNAALYASGIPLIIAAIVALIAVIVWLALKTNFFQTIWKGVWGFMKMVGAWFAGPFAGFFVRTWQKIVASLQRAKGQISTAINAVKNYFVGMKNTAVKMFNMVIQKFQSIVAKIKGGASAIKNATGRMFSGIWGGFKAGINNVIGGWNRLSFTIPSVTIFGKTLGGGTIGTPDISYLAKGGIVPATPGGRLAVIGEGGEDEAVIPLSKLPDQDGADGRPVIVQVVPGGEREFRRWIRKSIRVKGGILVDAGATA